MRRMAAAVAVGFALAGALAAQESSDGTTFEDGTLVTPKNPGPSPRVCNSLGAAAAEALKRAADRNWRANEGDVGGGRGGEGPPFGSLAETGGYIFRRADGSFGYTGGTTTYGDEPDNLLEDGTPWPGWRPQPMRVGADGRSHIIPSGEEIVGFYHVHPWDVEGGVSSPQTFSGGDLDFAGSLPGDGFVIVEGGDPGTMRRFMVPGDDWDDKDESAGDPAARWNRKVFVPSGSCRDPKTSEPPSPAPPPPPFGCACGLGFMSGEPHLLSHDGHPLTAQVAGEFVAVESIGRDLTVQARIEPFRDSERVSVVTALALQAGGTRIGIYNEPPHLLVDGKDAATLGLRLEEGATFGDGLTVRRAGREAEVVTPEGDRIRVLGLGRGWLDAAIALAPERRGRVAGLLGDFNGAAEDDLATRGGAILALPEPTAERHALLYEYWAPSWRILPEESLFDYREGRGPANYVFGGFPKERSEPAGVSNTARAGEAAALCEAAGVTEPVLQKACVYDIVATGDEAFATAHGDLMRLAAEMVAWRRPVAPVSDTPAELKGGGQLEPDLTANLLDVRFGASAEAILTGLDVLPVVPPASNVLVEDRRWVSADRRDWPEGIQPGLVLTLPGEVAPRLVALRVRHQDPAYRPGRIDLDISPQAVGGDFARIASVEVGNGAKESLIGFPATEARRIRLTFHQGTDTDRIGIDRVEAFEAQGEALAYEGLTERVGGDAGAGPDASAD